MAISDRLSWIGIFRILRKSIGYKIMLKSSNGCDRDAFSLEIALDPGEIENKKERCQDGDCHRHDRLEEQALNRAEREDQNRYREMDQISYKIFPANLLIRSQTIMV